MKGNSGSLMSKIILMSSPESYEKFAQYVCEESGYETDDLMSDPGDTEIPWHDVYPKNEPMGFVSVLYQHNQYPLAILDVSPEIGEVFSEMELYLNGKYSIKELCDIIKVHAQSNLVLQYSD